YFGDYYGDVYLRRGFHPWYEFSGRRGYDPLLVHATWDYRRRGVDYVAQLRTHHNDLVLRADLRPARTMTAQLEMQRRITDPRLREASIMGRPLREASLANQNVRLVQVAESQRREIERNRDQIRQL